jgi:hypothetical protein
MESSKSIIAVGDIFSQNTIRLPESPGVYAFWWIREKRVLMESNRHIVLKGPNGRPVDVKFMDWWPPELDHPCLYVGKSTNIKKRFSLHIKRKSIGRLHTIPATNEKQQLVTTSCQLRYGIEHVFKDDNDPLKIIYNSVGFSFKLFAAQEIAERFFTEDRLIGTWKPWFNVDSER